MFIPTWKCADGKLIPVNQMQESHIVNCIRLIQRRPNFRKEWLPRLELELEIRRLMRK